MVCYLDGLLLRNASLKKAFHEKMLKTIYHVTKHFFDLALEQVAAKHTCNTSHCLTLTSLSVNFILYIVIVQLYLTLFYRISINFIKKLVANNKVNLKVSQNKK